MTKSTPSPIHAGDEVVRDIADQDRNKVRLGDMAPVFVRPGDKVTRSNATVNKGKVRLGDKTPVFAPKK